MTEYEALPERVAEAKRAAARHKRNLRRWKALLWVLLAASMVLSAHLWVLVWRLP